MALISLSIRTRLSFGENQLLKIPSRIPEALRVTHGLIFTDCPSFEKQRREKKEQNDTDALKKIIVQRQWTFALQFEIQTTQTHPQQPSPVGVQQ